MSSDGLMMQPHQDGTATLYLGAGETHLTWIDCVKNSMQLLVTAGIAANWADVPLDIFKATVDAEVRDGEALIDHIMGTPPAGQA